MNAAQAAPEFAFESAFWRNLHHTLYAFANSRWSAGRRPHIRLREEDVAIVDGLPSDARTRWAASVGWYIAHLADRDLRTDDELREAGRALSAADADSDLRGVALPAGMRDVLRSVAADYRAHLWPGHSAVNARWRAELEPLLRRHGARVAARLACAFGSEWPSEPVPVTLTPYAKPLGAYTSLDPTLVTMATSDSRYQGVAAFEMLMHEVSHELIFPLRERLSAAIAALAGGSRPGLPHLQSDLWHEAIFFMTGRIVADEIPGYVPYGDATGLWSRAWPGPVRQALEQHLGAYLDGRVPAEVAVTGLVRELAEAGVMTGTGE